MPPAVSISRLSEYLHELGIFKRLRLPLKAGELRYNGVSFDSRSTRPGDLFVAYRGLARDSHEYIVSALERGAVAVCCERTQHGALNVPVVVTSSGRRALSAAAALLHGFPSRALDMVGVTGTNGKTTTTFMITRCLEAAGLRTGLIGTLAYKLEADLEPSSITTPDAPQLQKLLARMRDSSVQHVTMEVSSHALAQNRVADIDFDTAVITNISADHLDVHHSLEEYLDTKARLFLGLRPGSLAVYNADDPFATALAGQTRALTVGVGRRDSVDVQLRRDRVVFGQRVATVANRAPGSIHLCLRLPGAHNTANAALAATVAYVHGAPLTTIEHALNTFRGLPRRLQVLYNGDYLVVDDFAHNPGSMEAVFQTLEDDNPQPKVFVYAVRGNRGTVVNADNGRVIARWADRLNVRLLIVSLSRDVVAAKDKPKRAELDAFLAPVHTARVPYEVHDELSSSLARALNEVRPGEIVLLLGAQGMDPAAGLLRELSAEVGDRAIASSAVFELASELRPETKRPPEFSEWEEQLRTALFDVKPEIGVDESE